MPFPQPTLTELRQQGLSDIENADIPGVDAFLPFGVLPVLTWAIANMAVGQYGYLAWIAKQAVPWTAEDEFLDGWGELKNVFRKAASAAVSPQAAFPIGNGAQPIPAGTLAARYDGVVYQTTAPSVVSGSSAIAPVIAVTAAAAGNTAAGTTLVLQTAVPGVQATGTLVSPATGGADIEDDEDYRSRVMAAYQAPGSDGREAEYINWALAVPGVTRAWVNRNGFGDGTVVVYVMFDQAEAATGGFPVGANGSATGETRYSAATGDQLTVANAIWPQQAVTALVIVCSPVAQPVNFSITDLGSGNTAANQSAITAALQDMFERVSAPGGTIHPNQWEAAIGSLDLSQFAVAGPTGPVVAANAGSMPVLGAITFAS